MTPITLSFGDLERATRAPVRMVTPIAATAFAIASATAPMPPFGSARPEGWPAASPARRL